MQIRCYNCHMLFAISRDVVHAVLDEMEDEDMQHYDFRCPKCRRANRVSKERLSHAAPGWTRSREETQAADE
jgi:hypothetical protein